MDLQDFIKVEHESPINSNNKEINFYMTHFYDTDSQDQVKQEYEQYELQNDKEIIEYLEDRIDLRLTGIEEIMEFAQADPIICQEIDWPLLKKKIIKKKILLKRDFAKRREYKGLVKKQIYIFGNNQINYDEKQDIQAEIKKKRNRMSAQISRDRRKFKIQELESSNTHLKEETQRIKLENEKLKRQLEQFNKYEESQKTQSNKPGKNKFMTLLIMLGVLFLLSLFKESTTKANEVSIPKKLEDTKRELSNERYEEGLIENSQKTFIQIERSSTPIFGNKKSLNSVIGCLQKMKQQIKEVRMPESLKRQIENVKANLF